MNSFKRVAVLLAGLLTLAACVRPATDAAPSPAAVPAAAAGADEAAIRAAGDAWNTAHGALNVDALLGLYSDDAVLMPETARTAKGSAQIRDFLQIYMALLKDGGYKPTVPDAIEIDVSGNLGFSSGTYWITDKDNGNVDTGKWLQIWRKEDGKWRIIREIWNSDMLPLFPPSSLAGAGGTAE